MSCYIGPWPEMGKNNLFSEKPIIAIREGENAFSTKEGDVPSSEYKVVAFDTIAAAFAYRKKEENPDIAPVKVKIYAFAHGEWRLVSMVAESN